MKRRLVKYFVAIAAVLAMVGCGSEETPVPVTKPPEEIPETPEEPENLEFTSFRFRRTLNSHQLLSTIECAIDSDQITVRIPYANDLTHLTATFEGDFHEVLVAGEKQQSDVTQQDFSKAVLYTLVDSNGYQRTYRVVVKTGSGIPVVRIDTDSKLPVDSKEIFVDAKMEISNIPEHGGDFSSNIGIRGRGNATWSAYPKKPYRIKLDKKASLMGFPAHKDWALMAEYCDKSLLRNSYLWEMSRIAGLDWACRSQHVELFLNGEYVGTYLLCENVKEGEGRIEVEPGGFVIERDNYWREEQLWFGTPTFAEHYTFKYPDPDKDIVRNDANYKYIQSYMQQFETALRASFFADPAEGYRKYVDAESFARWYLVQEILGNIDTNPYFVMEMRGAKLKMYPPWDAEWCLGIAGIDNGWARPPFVSPVDKLYWKDGGYYFTYMIRDPWFCNLLRTEWAKMKARIPELEASIARIANEISYSQADNFKRWDILGKFVSVELQSFSTWRGEVDFAADFLRRRIAWFDQRIKSYPD